MLKLAEKVGKDFNSTQRMYINMIFSGTSIYHTMIMIGLDRMGRFKWAPFTRRERLAHFTDRSPGCLAAETRYNFGERL